MLKKAMLGGLLVFAGNKLDFTILPKMGAFSVPWWEIAGIVFTLLSLWIFLVWLQRKIQKARIAKEKVHLSRAKPVAPVIYQVPMYQHPNYVGRQEIPPQWNNLPQDKYELLTN